jgi:hypothetical protein
MAHKLEHLFQLAQRLERRRWAWIGRVTTGRNVFGTLRSSVSGHIKTPQKIIRAFPKITLLIMPRIFGRDIILLCGMIGIQTALQDVVYLNKNEETT